MTSVKCNVKNCAYNKQYSCHANGIIISPKGGKKNEITCCSSFLDQSAYSNVASCGLLKEANAYVQCRVGDCAYYVNGTCMQSMITVQEDYPAQRYIETYCESFRER